MAVKINIEKDNRVEVEPEAMKVNAPTRKPGKSVKTTDEVAAGQVPARKLKVQLSLKQPTIVKKCQPSKTQKGRKVA
jgi:hypothetical protein